MRRAIARGRSCLRRTNSATSATGPCRSSSSWRFGQPRSIPPRNSSMRRAVSRRSTTSRGRIGVLTVNRERTVVPVHAPKSVGAFTFDNGPLVKLLDDPDWKRRPRDSRCVRLRYDGARLPAHTCARRIDHDRRGRAAFGRDENGRAIQSQSWRVDRARAGPRRRAVASPAQRRRDQGAPSPRNPCSTRCVPRSRIC